MVIERLFDGLTMLFFVFLALPLVRFDSQALADYRTPIILFTILFFAALMVFLVLAARPKLAHRVYVPLVSLLVPEGYRARVLQVADRFLEGVASLARGYEVFLIFATSVLVWLCETAKYWFVMHAFPFQVSFFTLMLMNGVVNLFTTIPGAPGHAGTFDAPGIKILESAGVVPNMAIAYTLVLHAALWLPITLLGAFFLWRSHVSLEQAQVEISAGDASPTESR